jgi:F-type H+-transporting ATPase subunit epsilon
MYLDIVTPERKIFSGEVELVSVPGSDGYFEVMQNHAAIISTLKKGELKIVEKLGKNQFFNIEGGVIEVKSNKIIILAEKLKEAGN